MIVMCHTRELAFQIKNEYARFSKYIPFVKTAVFYGGTPIQKDAEILKNKETHPHIVVGTPGRLNALVRDKALRLGNVKAFVLDECDKMLDQIGKVLRSRRKSIGLDYLGADLIILPQICDVTFRRSSVLRLLKSRS